MSELKAWKQKRGVEKGRIKTFKNFLTKIVTVNPNSDVALDEQSQVELRERIEKLNQAFAAFELIQTAIQEFGEFADDVYLAEREEFENEYYDALATAKILLSRGVARPVVDGVPQAPQQFVNDRVNMVGGANVIQQANPIGGMRLPVIELPKFKGDLSEWLRFRDTFRSLIHDNPSIQKIQKFHYLQAALEGSALEAIDEYEFSDDNYEEAWKSLHDRYDNPKVLIHNHIEAIFKLKGLANESAGQILELIDSVTKHTRALKKLDEPTEHWDSLLIYLIVSKIDAETAKEWERQKSNLQEKAKLSDLLKCLRARAALLQTLQSKEGKKNEKGHHGKSKSFHTGKATCANCKEEHYIQNCDPFLKFTAQERAEKVKGLKLCHNCLRPGHFAKACTSGSCKRCKAKHNTLLHFERSSDSANSKEAPSSNPSTSTTMCATNAKNASVGEEAILATALVKVSGDTARKGQARAFLDSCSQSNFITERLCKQLRLTQSPSNVQIGVLNQVGPTLKGKCEVEITSRHNGYKFKIQCLVTPSITDELMPNAAFSLQQVDIPPNVKLADPTFNSPGEIDLLIGAQWFWDLLCVGQIKLNNNLVMQKTKLGWVIGGPMTAPASQVVQCYFSKTIKLEDQLTKFWELEETPTKRALSREEQACEEHFIKTTKRDEEGRFVVQLPLKQDASSLGHSRHQAEKRLCNLERRLQSNEELNRDYSNFLKEYEILGHMTRVQVSEDVPGTYYMPHHCVVRSDSETTKLRVVFDASASTTNGLSLNDIQLTGPVIQSDLFSILTRFRKHTCVVSADIAKMYRQVLIDPEQRPLQRILWRENRDQELQTFELKTVTYGTTAASFLAIRCLMQLAIDCEEEAPEAAKIIKNDFYVDDLLTGGETIDEVIANAQTVSDVLKSGCFELRKWHSNRHEICSQLAATDEPFFRVNLTRNEQKRTLGLVWNAKLDVLTYSVSIPSITSVTKRQILSITAMIFDPLGLVAPCTVTAKMIMQRLWQEKLDWDESLPSQLQSEWKTYCSQLQELNDFQIPRQAVAPDRVKIQLHGFADASKSAYGACVYVRVVDKQGRVQTNLLCSKSKIAPLKTQTIPRLELCGAALLAKLIAVSEAALDTKVESIVYWSDSTIVLGWLRSEPNTLPVFESNRVARIQELSKGRSWRHVPTDKNPADLLSRGTTPRELINCSLWWHGPEFMKNEAHAWPSGVISEVEIPSAEITMHVSKMKMHVYDDLLATNSSLAEAVRILAYSLRFLSYLQGSLRDGGLTAAEVDTALIHLAKHSQKESFSNEIAMLKRNNIVRNGRIAALSPFLDEEGILRVGGRLKNSNFESDKKHPILLSADHEFTRLLFAEEHRKSLHAGPQSLLALIRERFWPLKGRKLARKTVKACTTCVRYNPKPMQPMMGNLPLPRVTPMFPFETTGTDYAGPFFIKERKGRGSKTSKCYICLFVCFATKALHLELVSDLTKDAFIAALRRFVARRGKPSKIYSDNGTNFVGANNELKELGNFLANESRELSQSMADDGIAWHFIPAYSPHFGGLWEAGVKSTKYHLKRVAGNASLLYEEFSTLLAQIESLLNSRPITPLSSDPNDLSPLTPAHFLIGRQFTSVADPTLQHLKESRLSNWQRVQQMQQHIWERWSKEYIAELQQRVKWKTPFPTLEHGTLVLLKEDNLPPSKWRLGRVVDVHPGSDGISRDASIRTSNGIIRRAFVKLCPLPTADEETAHV